MKELATDIAVTVVAFVFLGLTVWTAAGALLDLPVVQKSWLTGECVRVVYQPPGEEHDCNNLPERYTLEWVE